MGAEEQDRTGASQLCDRRAVDQQLAYPYNGVLNKEKLTTDWCNNMYKAQRYAYLKNSDPKEHKLLIPYI